MALEMCRALASATNLFKHPKLIVPVPVKVLYIEQEVGPYGLQKRIHKVFKEEKQEVWQDHLWYVSKDPTLKLDSNEGVMAIDRVLDEVKPGVVIMDPFGKMHTSNDSDNQDIEKIFNNISKLIKWHTALDMSVVLIHHFGKPPFVKEKGNHYLSRLDPYNFRGAAKFKEAPDTLLTAIRGREHAHKDKTKWWEGTASFTLRHDAEPENFKLHFNEREDLRVIYAGDNPGGDFSEGPPKLEEVPVSSDQARRLRRSRLGL